VVQRALVLQAGDKVSAQDIVIDRPMQSRIETQIKHAQAWLVG
jgi:hypothetical protein